jgi:hypothetical protein
MNKETRNKIENNNLIHLIGHLTSFLQSNVVGILNTILFKNETNINVNKLNTYIKISDPEGIQDHKPIFKYWNLLSRYIV